MIAIQDFDCILKLTFGILNDKDINHKWGIFFNMKTFKIAINTN